MNFDDLFADMPRYNSLREIKPLKKLFNILSGEESVRKMIEANDIAKRPAICGVIKFIEKFCDRHSGEGLNIDAEKEIGPDGRAALTEKGRKAVFLRRFIGAMINAIMGNNGYTIKKGQKIIGGGLSKYFSSGARFGNPSKAGEGRELGRSGARKRSVKAQREASGRKETTRRRKTAQAGNRLVLTEAEIAGFIAEAFQTAAAASAGAVYEKGGRDEKFTYISDGFISYPFSETVLAYSRLHYMSAYQIACEIELNHPGIVEMTGMSFMPDIDEGPENGVKDELNQLDLRLENDMFTTNRDKSFVDTIQDFLVRECAQNIGAEKRRHAAIEGGGGFEMAVLANYFEPEGTIFRNCDLEYFRPERKFLLFQIGRASCRERV